MKRSGTTPVFVIGCIAVLVGAYLAGICIRGIRFRNAGVEPERTAVVETAAAKPASANSEAQPAPAPDENVEPDGAPAAEQMAEQDEQRPGGMRERFEAMSEEERQQAMEKMRERFASRRRDGGLQGPQMSEEDREKMRAEMDELRSRWEGMSEEERQEAMNQMREKYGFAPRMGGSGGRRPGGRSGGMRQDNNQ